MKGRKQKHISIEILIGGATVLLSTTSCLLGSPKLSLIALVVGAISFGIILGARDADTD